MDYQLFADTFKPEVIEIPNIDTFEGTMPTGYELVEYQKDTNPMDYGLVLYGFDELYMFGFTKPKHCFVRQACADKMIDTQYFKELAPETLAHI